MMVLSRILVLFWDKVTYKSGWPQTSHKYENGLEFLILLSLPSKFWDSRQATSNLVCAVLELKPRVLWVLGKHATDWAAPLAPEIRSLRK